MYVYDRFADIQGKLESKCLCDIYYIKCFDDRQSFHVKMPQEFVVN